MIKYNIAIEKTLSFTDNIVKNVSDENIKFEFITSRTNLTKAIKWLWQTITSKATIFHNLYGGYMIIFYLLPLLLRKKVIIHWIGTDVYELTKLKNKNIFLFKIRLFLLKKVTKHLVVSEWLQKELKNNGIDSDIVPLIPHLKLNEGYEKPEKNCVFVYLPEQRAQFYGSEIIFKLAKNFSNLNFIITRHSGTNAPKLPNIRYYNWVDNIETIWQQTTIYMRLTEHDGLSHSIIEALSRGKHVIWSQEFPCCYHAENYEQAKVNLREVLKNKSQNSNGINFIKDNYNTDKLTLNFINLYRNI